MELSRRGPWRNYLGRSYLGGIVLGGNVGWKYPGWKSQETVTIQMYNNNVRQSFWEWMSTRGFDKFFTVGAHSVYEC